jgi:DNA-binding response OmpR family regulator
MNISKTPITVLVVDDEQRLRNLVHGYLAREGFVVLTASDGITALGHARQHALTRSCWT